MKPFDGRLQVLTDNYKPAKDFFGMSATELAMEFQRLFHWVEVKQMSRAKVCELLMGRLWEARGKVAFKPVGKKELGQLAAKKRVK